VQLVLVVEQVAPLLAVTVYPVIDEPPSDAGAVQETTDSFVAFALALTEVGASGLPLVVAEAVLEDDPVPKVFVAVTVKV
jgi:hypothetical protein